MYSTTINRKPIPVRHKWFAVPFILLLIWILLSPSFVSALAGFGDYISEKLLGDGTNESQYLGDGTNGLVVLGSGPVVSTLPATGVSMTGGGRATLLGSITSLNGMPQADVWFVWGYSASALSNTTPASTVFAAGEQSYLLTGFDTKQTVYYQFRAGTDGTSSGGTTSLIADKGFFLLDVALPIVIALAILVFMSLATGNIVMGMFGSTIGLIAFYVIKAMLEAIS